MDGVLKADSPYVGVVDSRPDGVGRLECVENIFDFCIFYRTGLFLGNEALAEQSDVGVVGERGVYP